MDLIDVILLCVAVVIAIVFPIIGIRLEKKAFNGGVCPLCGRNLRLFDFDSQGGRGYKCEYCGYHTWVSYNCVDKKFREEIFK